MKIEYLEIDFKENIKFFKANFYSNESSCFASVVVVDYFKYFIA